MTKARILKVAILGIFVLMLAIPLRAQNTKGDKPVQSRETRFQKPVKRQKPSKRIKARRTTTSLRAYKPRKKSKGGEVAGRPSYPIRRNKPDERPNNVYNNRRLYVNNSSNSRKSAESKRGSRSIKRVEPRSATGRTRNVYPQTGTFVNRRSDTRDRNPIVRRKVKPRSASRSFTARRSTNAWARFPKQKQKPERAHRGDISGRRIRTKNYQSKRPDVIPAPRTTTQSSGRANRRSQAGGFSGGGGQSRPRSGVVSNKTTIAKLNQLQRRRQNQSGRHAKVTPRSASGSFQARKSTNTWAHFPRPKRKGERAVTTDIAGKKLRTKNYQTPARGVIPAPSRRTPSVSGQGAQSRSSRVRSISSSGKAKRGDIAGRFLRRRNFSSKRNIETVGQQRGGYNSRSPAGQRTAKIPVKPPGIGGKGVGNYKGNIQGRKGFNNQGEEYTGGIKSRRRAQGGGSVSGRLWNNNRSAISPRTPGIGARGINTSGNIKTGRRVKGGGSASGRLWNNNNSAIAPRTPGIGAKGVNTSGNLRGRRGFSNQGEEYSGNIKTGRRVKGGGSVSGKLWNNNNSAIAPRTPGIGAKGVNTSGNLRGRRGFSNQGEEYSGNIKTGRRVKGGGSVSGRLWNNNNSAIPARAPGMGANGLRKYSGNIRGRRGFNNQGEEFTGFIKARRPAKGGGSLSGKLWNNNQTPVQGRTPGIGAASIRNYRGTRNQQRGFSNQGEEYTGDMKVGKRLKGGGSISRHWNNKQSPISVKSPSKRAAKAGGFPGKIRENELNPGFNNQGEEYTGDIKARKPLKGGGSITRHWNNNERPIEVRAPKSEQGGEFSGNLKVKRGYTKNPNAAEGALSKRKPTESTYRAGGLQIKVKQRDHGLRRNAPEGALAGLKPTKESIKASEYTRVVRRDWKYVKNESSAKASLKTREPGKAFARATDYQGNIKMKKYDLFGKKDLHPDAQFVKTNKNNVSGEKDMFTNFKLWWARLFKKNDTQPDHLKDRDHKPRYDPSEKGLWYD